MKRKEGGKELLCWWGFNYEKIKLEAKFLKKLEFLKLENQNMKN